MGNLLTRRRELILASNSPPLPEWDYEWWGANEKVAPRGWTKTTDGTASAGMSGEYWRVSVSTQYGWLQYAWPETFSKGVIQVHFRCSTTYGNVRFYLSNGTNAIGVRANRSGASGGVNAVLLNDNSSVSSMTRLASFTSSVSYKLKLVLDNGYADVYFGNVGDTPTLVASHVDITTITDSSPLNMTTLRFTSSAATGYASNWYLYAILMKFNRTE